MSYQRLRITIAMTGFLALQAANSAQDGLVGGVSEDFDVGASGKTSDSCFCVPETVLPIPDSLI